MGGYATQPLPTQGDAIDFSSTSNPTGFSSVTTNSSFYKKIAPKLWHVNVLISGTSNSTSFVFTLPFSVAYSETFVVRIRDNGAAFAYGVVITTAGSATVNVYTSPATAGFTAANNKQLNSFNAVLSEQ